MKINNILFDLDGTLVDTSPGIEYSLREAISTVLPGKIDKFHDLQSQIGPPLREMLNKITGSNDNKMLDEIEHQFRLSYDSIGWNKCVAYDGVIETVARIFCAKINCYILTNKPIVPTNKILSQLKLSSYFAEIVSPDSQIPHFKSKIEMVSYVIEKYQLNAKNIILIGDSISDANAAQAFNIEFVAAAYGFGHITVHNQWQKHFVINEFRDLMKIL